MAEKIRASKILYELQEAGRVQMENDKPSVDDLLDRNLALMVNRIDMVISREAYDDEEIVYTSNACPSERATLLRVYNAKVGDEQLAYASSIWSIVNFKTRRIVKAKELNMKNYKLIRYRNPFGYFYTHSLFLKESAPLEGSG